MSCYAFFEWWLPLSQHPSCPGLSTSFDTWRALEGLIRRSWALSLSATELISRSLTPGRVRARNSEFSLAQDDAIVPRQSGALPPRLPPEASPKAISGRTSYNPARLEFHHEPQIVRCLFNESRFGPPQGFTPASSCPWLARRVSGLRWRTCRPVKARFRSGSASAAYPRAPTQLAGSFFNRHDIRL